MAESSSHKLAREAVDLAAAAAEVQQLDISESSSSCESAQDEVVVDLAAAGEAMLPPAVLQLDIPEGVIDIDLAAAGEAMLLGVQHLDNAAESSSSYESAQEAVVDLATAGEPALPEVLRLDIPESSSSSYESAQEAAFDLAAAEETCLLPDRPAGQTMDAGMTRDERNGSSGSGWVGAAWSFCQHWPGPMDARFIYAAIFLFGDVSAWVVRENPKIFFKAQRHSGCHGDRDCLASEAVLMISFANFLFFSIMDISTLYTKTIHDGRSFWHSGWWPAKIILLLGCYMTSIALVPTYILQLYGRVAPFGSGLFLIIQLISVIRYITRLNSKWCGQENFNNHRHKVNMISKLAYGCSMVGIILMILFYVGDYRLNAWLIVATLLLVYIMPLISSFTKAKGFYMEPLLMGMYIAFLCWSALKSEPGKENTGSAVNWKTMISFIASLFGVTVNAFSTGTYYKCIQFTNVVPSGNAAPYGYAFFHFIFATGSMNFGMMYLGWDTHHALGKWSMDVGWTSTIVHIVNEGLAVVLFVVVMLARFYGIGGRLQQLLGNGTGEQQLADESRAIEQARFYTDNNAPPRESTATTEPVETERNNAQPPSSSSTTGLHLRTSETQELVVGRQYGEITEHWLSPRSVRR